jgi:hypothetical protein
MRQPNSRRCVGDVLSENNNWKNLASANVKKVRGGRHENLEEALAILARAVKCSKQESKRRSCRVTGETGLQELYTTAVLNGGGGLANKIPLLTSRRSIFVFRKT